MKTLEELAEVDRQNRLAEIWPWTPIQRAVASGDSGYVRGWLDATFDVEVTPADVTEFITLAHQFNARHQTFGYAPEDAWPNDWRMWFKVRLEAAGYFPPGGGRGAGHVSLPTELHAGFLYLVETDEELERLRRPDRSADDRPVGPSGCAEPGIERTALVLRPIDAVARRVASVE